MAYTQRSSRSWAPLATVAAVALLLTACSDSENDTAEEPDQSEASTPSDAETDADDADSEDTGSEDDASEDETGDADQTGQTPEFDDTPLGQMNADVFDLINASEPTEAADWEPLLDDALTAEMSAEDLAEVVNQQVHAGGPWLMESYAPVSEEASATVLTSDAGRLSMELSIDPESELITGLLFNPLPEPGEPAESFEELEEALDELPVEVTMAVVEDGETLYERGADEVMPLASTAKLYVLYALAQAVEDGEASWEDTLTVTDELRSLPSGELQEEDAGFEVSVADAAGMMIAISDNTATDMLIDYLGRESVEEAVAAADHHDPSLMTPYLSTGEIFYLEWQDPDLGEQYLQANEDGRRAILEDIADETLEIDPTDVTPDTTTTEGLEWYATAEDIVSVHQALVEAGDNDSTVTEALTFTPGPITVPEDPWWDEIAFKGGNLQETLTGSWTLTDSKGRERTVVVLVHGEDPVETQSLMGPVYGLAQDAFTLED